MNTCPDCKCDFTRLGSHWAVSDDCKYPKLNITQEEIITGVLMGDGWIKRKNGRNPYFAVTMTNEEYLEYLDSKLGIHSIGVSPTRSAQRSAEISREHGLNIDADESNYSNLFTLRSRSNPNLSSFAQWYSGGGKTFPESIHLSPTVLKNWYVSDGNMHRDGYIQIGIQNEKNNINKIKKYFNDVKLPTPKVNSYNNNTIIYWTVDDSKCLLDYMGSPIQGFEYKW
jgi:hypothetical protein